MTQEATRPTTTPMDADTATRRRALLKTLARGTKLLVTEGLKKGRTAVYRGPDDDNPWLLRVAIDGVPRVVRFDWVTVE
jgi:hypothetical protein